MVDKNLSGRTAATLPLAGTELAYIIQGGNTRKVTVADLWPLAEEVVYDPGAGPLLSTDVQSAIDELAAATVATDGDKGDITVSGAGTVFTIDNDVVTNAKAANMAQSTIKGRAASAGTGDPTDLSVAQVVAIIGDTDITLAANSDALVATQKATKAYVDAAVAGGFTTASTTEVLTGTNTTKGVTPDALAALWEKGADVASAGTFVIGEGGYLHATGTTGITDIDWTTAKDGRTAWVIFDGILTLTHHATTLKLPGGANITTAAGDRALFVQDSSDNVICLAYIRADGTALSAPSAAYGKQSIWVPASAMTAATTNGPATGQIETTTNKVNIPVLDFDATTAEQAWFSISFPKSWDEGTVTFRAKWCSTATDTDGIAISLAGIAFSDNETLDTAVGTPVVVTDDAQSNSTEHYVTAESSAVTIAGTPAEADTCFFRVQRVVSDGNDDMSEDMRLIGIDVFYVTNAVNDA